MTNLLILILIISFLGTIFVMMVAIKKNIIDVPNSRSSHLYPKPRGGGVGILLAWFTGIIILYSSGNLEKNLFLALSSGAILAIVSLIDDLISIKPWIRIIFQFLSAGLGIYFLGGCKIIIVDGFPIQLPFAFNLVILIGFIWFINLFNFLDGIDGYASMQAITTAFGMFIIIGHQSFLILIFSILGFLIWNWPQARIFMGDIGSTQLGFILMILGIHFSNTSEFSLIGFLILTSLFWFDATLTLFRRWRNREQLSKPHKKHAYQRIVQSGFSHLKTLIISIFINTFFIVIVYSSENNIISYFFSFILCLLINILLNIFIDKRFPFETSPKLG